MKIFTTMFLALCLLGCKRLDRVEVSQNPSYLECTIKGEPSYTSPSYAQVWEGSDNKWYMQGDGLTAWKHVYLQVPGESCFIREK